MSQQDKFTSLFDINQSVRQAFLNGHYVNNEGQEVHQKMIYSEKNKKSLTDRYADDGDWVYMFARSNVRQQSMNAGVSEENTIALQEFDKFRQSYQEGGVRGMINMLNASGAVNIASSLDDFQKDGSMIVINNGKHPHAALLLIDEDGQRYVSEMVYGKGFQKTKLEDWFQANQNKEIQIGDTFGALLNNVSPKQEQVKTISINVEQTSGVNIPEVKKEEQNLNINKTAQQANHQKSEKEAIMIDIEGTMNQKLAHTRTKGNKDLSTDSIEELSKEVKQTALEKDLVMESTTQLSEGAKHTAPEKDLIVEKKVELDVPIAKISDRKTFPSDASEEDHLRQEAEKIREAQRQHLKEKIKSEEPLLSDDLMSAYKRGNLFKNGREEKVNLNYTQGKERTYRSNGEEINYSLAKSRTNMDCGDYIHRFIGDSLKEFTRKEGVVNPLVQEFKKFEKAYSDQGASGIMQYAKDTNGKVDVYTAKDKIPVGNIQAGMAIATFHPNSPNNKGVSDPTLAKIKHIGQVVEKDGKLFFLEMKGVKEGFVSTPLNEYIAKQQKIGKTVIIGDPMAKMRSIANEHIYSKEVKKMPKLDELVNQLKSEKQEGLANRKLDDVKIEQPKNEQVIAQDDNQFTMNIKH